jgi:hypothetical protein
MPVHGRWFEYTLIYSAGIWPLDDITYRYVLLATDLNFNGATLVSFRLCQDEAAVIPHSSGQLTPNRALRQVNEFRSLPTFPLHRIEVVTEKMASDKGVKSRNYYNGPLFPSIHLPQSCGWNVCPSSIICYSGNTRPVLIRKRWLHLINAFWNQS